jgi:hypothetical protein
VLHQLSLVLLLQHDGLDLLHDVSVFAQVPLVLLLQHDGLDLLHDVSVFAQVPLVLLQLPVLFVVQQVGPVLHQLSLDFLLFASFLLQMNCVTDCNVSLAP